MRDCAFCPELVDLDDEENYREVTSWVHGEKLDGPKLRTQTGRVAHKKCVDNLIAGQAPDQPELFSNDEGLPKTLGVTEPCPDCLDDPEVLESHKEDCPRVGTDTEIQCGPPWKAIEGGVQRHTFEVFDGATGQVCTAMVMRFGGGDSCGLPADHSIHYQKEVTR